MGDCLVGMYTFVTYRDRRRDELAKRSELETSLSNVSEEVMDDQIVAQLTRASQSGSWGEMTPG